MADVANRAGKYAQAMSMYQRALETMDQDGERADPSRKIHALDMLGQVSYFQGLYDESLASHQRALDIVYSTHGEESTWCMVIFPRISGNYLAQGKYEEAIRWSKKVLHDFSATQRPTFRAYASRLIGDAYLEMRQTEPASEYLDYALSTYRRYMEWNNLYTARTMSLLGRLRFLENRVGAAETYFKEAAEMVITRYGRRNMNSVWSLEMYASFLVDTDKPDEAIESLQEILKLYREEIGSGNLRSTFALHALGRAFAKKQQYEESITQYLEALEILEQHYGSNYTPEAAAIMRNLSYSYVCSGGASKGKDMLQIAASIYAKKLGQGHILHKEVEKELESLKS
jgi:tetratricopeptide (TPR) repeat protein